MKQLTYLQIAGFKIKVNSKNPPEANPKSDWRYQNFILKRAPKKIDFEFNLKVKDNYTHYKPQVLFQTEREKKRGRKNLAARRRRKRRLRLQKQKNNAQRKEKEKYLGPDLDWRISKYKNKFLLEGGTSGNFQVFFDKSFKKLDVSIINSDRQWKLADVFVGFLQIFLIYYFASKGRGLVVHSTGIKDKAKRGKGYLFAGISGAGKTTTSKIWDKQAKDIMVLNDDRIIIRKINNKFYLYGTPWHGDFSDYLKVSVERARLSKLFFIYHKNKNKAQKVIPREFFNLFFQSVFLPFWDKRGLKTVSNFMIELILSVPCYKFGFKNNKKIIDYVRNI